MKKLLLMGLLLALCVMVSPVLAATIKTDKADYAPESTVKITGTGFNQLNHPVYITVTRPTTPDPTIDSLAPVYTDATGSFEALYKLDGIQGTYSIDASDSDGFTAQTTFTDRVLIPEFPSMVLPLGMIIGIFGFIFLIKTR
jgi:hypothetical protein